ncbi:hypothetical protein NLI96_g13163 [Meripilus lineatus]|uniref:Uncharacterized protein n=1 Tax=Meripilus lineatus TaxID=2056292 RepID=A0AAD5UQC5_9APHY|nr:hypothetical protein NLI96_g13163 [Physisporinus lineatus]
MRIIHQRSITLEQVQLVDKLLVSFVEEFEQLYYQGHPGRLHFVRQSIHLLLHIAPQIILIGPGCYSAQWTMERLIGDLGAEIWLHSDPYGNLSVRLVLRGQVNAFKGAYIGPVTETKLPQGAVSLGGGYVLLCAADEHEVLIAGPHGDALSLFWGLHLPPDSDRPLPKIRRWARLRLPNGQVARSLWKEGQRPLEGLRIARNVKASIEFTQIIHHIL